MVYDLSDFLEREQFTTRVEYLMGKSSPGGNTFRVELTEKKQRTLAQNAYLHCAMAYFALQIGLPMQEVKEVYFKAVCNPDLFQRTRFDNILGCERTFMRSSKDLTKEEMTTAIDRFLKFASEKAGIYIPPSDEYIAVQRMQHEVERNSRYL